MPSRRTPPRSADNHTMRKVLIVALTEFLNAVRSKAFIISVLMVPALLSVSIGIQVLVSKRSEAGDRRFAVIDHTRQLYPVIAAAAAAWNGREQAQTDEPRPTYLPEEIEPSADAAQLDRQ